MTIALATLGRLSVGGGGEPLVVREQFENIEVTIEDPTQLEIEVTMVEEIQEITLEMCSVE
jgi:hypothetical protein